jgi:hypothetical protein
MSEQAKTPNPFDLLIEQIRTVVREEIKAAIGKKTEPEKDWLRAEELAAIYDLPKTWFEDRGRSGEIARTKPGRYVLFNRRDVERYFDEHKSNKGA